MKVKFFTIAFSPEHAKFDTSEMDKFLIGKKVCSVKEHFFEHQGKPYCALLVTYCDSHSLDVPHDFSGEHRQNRSASAKNAERVRALTESQRNLYEALKNWRIERAKQIGVPAYFIFHDQQLLEIVSKLPQSITALTEIRGIGQSKSQQYGAQILEVIEKWRNADPSANE